MEGVVLVAGKGTRLRPLTLTVPKPLIPVAGKPLVQYGIEQMREVGVSRLTMVVGWLGELFEQTFGSEVSGIPVRYVEQPKRLGVAHAIHVAVSEGGIRSPFLVYLGDNIFDDEWVKHFKELDWDYDALVFLAKVGDPRRFGVPVFEGGRIVRFVEKPKNPPSPYALTGLYAFRDPEQFERCYSTLKPSWRGEYEITDLLNCYIKKGLRLAYGVVEGWWKDTGVPADLLDAMKFIMDHKMPSKVEGEVDGRVEGKVYVAEGARVRGTLRGPAYVGPGAVVEGEVGPYVNAEAGSLVRGRVSESLLLKGSVVELGEGASVRKAILGSRAVVRVGAPVSLEEAVLASESSLNVR
ncbi:MAG: NTP transferase domain-containing protein [Crenarchaeota archaeon]|nr:NTP transferase domain-containing protein [Thermoproteota archaeon]